MGEAARKRAKEAARKREKEAERKREKEAARKREKEAARKREKEAARKRKEQERADRIRKGDTVQVRRSKNDRHGGEIGVVTKIFARGNCQVTVGNATFSIDIGHLRKWRDGKFPGIYEEVNRNCQRRRLPAFWDAIKSGCSYVGNKISSGCSTVKNVFVSPSKKD